MVRTPEPCTAACHDPRAEITLPAAVHQDTRQTPITHRPHCVFDASRHVLEVSLVVNQSLQLRSLEDVLALYQPWGVEASGTGLAQIMISAQSMERPSQLSRPNADAGSHAWLLARAFKRADQPIDAGKGTELLSPSAQAAAKQTVEYPEDKFHQTDAYSRYMLEQVCDSLRMCQARLHSCPSESRSVEGQVHPANKTQAWKLRRQLRDWRVKWGQALIRAAPRPLKEAPFVRGKSPLPTMGASSSLAMRPWRWTSCRLLQWTSIQLYFFMSGCALACIRTC